MEEPFAILLVCAHHPYDYGLIVPELLPGLNDALGCIVAAGDASEDINEERLNPVVFEDEFDCFADAVWTGTSSEVEEVARVTTANARRFFGLNR